MRTDFSNWDMAVSLAYAAEQLVLAVQLLTSDVVPLPKAIAIAYESHVPAILEHKKWLPFDVSQQLTEAQADYSSTHQRRITLSSIQHFRSRLLQVLNTVNGYLQNFNPDMMAA